jgi:hypothetical protein
MFRNINIKSENFRENWWKLTAYDPNDGVYQLNNNVKVQLTADIQLQIKKYINENFPNASIFIGYSDFIEVKFNDPADEAFYLLMHDQFTVEIDW